MLKLERFNFLTTYFVIAMRTCFQKNFNIKKNLDQYFENLKKLITRTSYLSYAAKNQNGGITVKILFGKLLAKKMSIRKS